MAELPETGEMAGAGQGGGGARTWLLLRASAALLALFAAAVLVQVAWLWPLNYWKWAGIFAAAPMNMTGTGSS